MVELKKYKCLMERTETIEFVVEAQGTDVAHAIARGIANGVSVKGVAIERSITKWESAGFEEVR